MPGQYRCRFGAFWPIGTFVKVGAEPFRSRVHPGVVPDPETAEMPGAGVVQTARSGQPDLKLCSREDQHFTQLGGKAAIAAQASAKTLNAHPPQQPAACQ